MLIQTHSTVKPLPPISTFLKLNQIRPALLGSSNAIEQILYPLRSSSGILPEIVMTQASYPQSHTYGLLLNIKDVQNGAILSPGWAPSGHPLEAPSLGAAALTNAFCLVCRGTVDGIVLGFISYLMQCNWRDKINQGADTVLELNNGSSSKGIAERIFQRCWPQEVIDVKSLCNKTNLSRAR